MRYILAICTLGLMAAPASAGMPDEEIPENLRGVWAIDGKCHGGKTVTFTANTVQFTGHKATSASYDSISTLNGHDTAGYMIDDSHVGLFEFIPRKGEAILYPNGDPEKKDNVIIYKRCH